MKKHYFNTSKSNIINIIIIILVITSFIPYGNQLINNYLRRLTIIKIFTLFKNVDK